MRFEKKYHSKKILIYAAVIGLFVIPIYVLVFGVFYNAPDYYADKNNYFAMTCEVESINSNGNLKLKHSDTRAQYIEYFLLRDKNLNFVTDNGIFEEVKAGDIVLITGIKQHYGRGDTMFIAEFSKGGKTYLDFETGVANLSDEWKAGKILFLVFAVFLGLTEILCIAAYIWLSVLSAKDYKRQIKEYYGEYKKH